MAVTVAAASDCTKACSLASCISYEEVPVGMSVSIVTMVSFVVSHRPIACDSDMLVRTATVVIFSWPEVSKVSAPETSTTSLPSTLDNVSTVGPGPCAAYGTVREISVPGMWSILINPPSATMGTAPKAKVVNRRFDGVLTPKYPTLVRCQRSYHHGDILLTLGTLGV